MNMVLDTSVSLLAALQFIDDAKSMATQISVNRVNFLMLALYLLELRSLLDELNKQQDFPPSHLSWPALRIFIDVLEGIYKFIKDRTSRSRIYLICHIHELVQDMDKYYKQLADCVALILPEVCGVSDNCINQARNVHAKLSSATIVQEQGSVELANEILCSVRMFDHGTGNEENRKQRSLEILQSILKHLNLPMSEIVALKNELQADLKFALSVGNIQDVEELKQLCAFFDPDGVADSDDASDFIMNHSTTDSFEIPQAFFCPITKDVMREPVMVEHGHTYEKSAIFEWFRRGNRKCPDTGQELQCLELVPNRTLQDAINEYFGKMQKERLIHALQELKASVNIEQTVDTIGKIIDKDSNNRELLVSLGGIPLLMSGLKSPRPPHVRQRILRILYCIALIGEHYKLSIIDEDAVPVFLRILQKSPRDNGGPLQLLWELSKCEAGLKAILSVKGSILIIASAFTQLQNDQKLLAEKLIENLCHYDESVTIDVAQSSIFGPLISCLRSENEALKLKMTTAISTTLELNNFSGSALVKAGIIPPLLQSLQFGSVENRQAASTALLKLSMVDANKADFAKYGTISILRKLLQMPIEQFTVDILTILSNLVTNRQNAAELSHEDGITHQLGMFLPGPNVIQKHTLKILECLAKDNHTVRFTVADMKIVPIIYRILRNEGLSADCQESILNLLRYLAEDSQTRVALVTNIDTIKFLINLVSQDINAEIVLTVLAGLSRVDSAKRQLITTGTTLLTMCTRYLVARSSQKLQESAIVILSQLCDHTLIGSRIQKEISKEGLISALVEILAGDFNTEIAIQHAIMILGHFSRCTPYLTERLSLIKQILAWLGVKRFRICIVHRRKCSTKETFCIIEAGAIPVLINVMKEGSPQSTEQALEVLATVLNDEASLRQGIDFLVMNGIIPVLISIVGKSELVTEKVAYMMETIFRTKKYQDAQHTNLLRGSLAMILATGTANARKAASTALMHIKEIPQDTLSTFPTTPV